MVFSGFGLPLRVITMDVSKKEDEQEPQAFINPEIVWRADDRSVLIRFSLSVSFVNLTSIDV